MQSKVLTCVVLLVVICSSLAFMARPLRALALEAQIYERRLHTSSSTALEAKKKGGATGSPAVKSTAVKSTVGTVAAKGKPGEIRVKLLEDVKKIGKKSEVVFVSSAIFMNVLAPQRKAVRVNDEENASNVQAALEKVKELKAAAKEMGEEMSKLTSQKITRKVGKEGALFGVVANKHIIDHLTAWRALPDKSMVIEICELSTDGSLGSCLENVEIKRAGRYVARVRLNSEVEPAEFNFEVCEDTA